MNKLYVNGYFLHQRTTGVQRYAREILKGFDREGYPYTVLGPSPYFSSSKLGHHFWEQLLLPGKKLADSVLWSPTNTGPLYASNHVMTLHDVSVFEYPEWFSTYYAQWKMATTPRILSRAKMVITVSEFSKRIICRRFNIDPKNVHVVYNGVDTAWFKPSGSGSIKKVLSKYGITAPYLLTLGSLDPRKNHARLIKAWEQCVERDGIRGYSLVIAGGGNANFSYTKTTGSSSVNMPGYVEDEDLPALYSGAAAFLLPSLYEGFGLPVIEAMACGTPVLTSNTTALDEISGEAAVKVSPEDTDSIREGILMLLESRELRNTLIGKGFEQIKLFDWNKSAGSIYRHLMG